MDCVLLTSSWTGRGSHVVETGLRPREHGRKKQAGQWQSSTRKFRTCLSTNHFLIGGLIEDCGHELYDSGAVF